MPKLIHVAAAVIRDRRGHILIARRPDDKHQGGLWEFPGGKVEPNEPVADALARELQEELGIQVTSARPLILIPHHYPDKSVLLDVWDVDGFKGEAHGAEGQPICWVAPEQLDEYDFPAANTPIVAAARLPERMLITGSAATQQEYAERLQAALGQGIKQVMLRAKTLSECEFADLFKALLPLCQQQGACLGVNTSVEQANALGAEHLHLTSERLLALGDRAEFNGRWLSASCHNPEQIRMAEEKGLDFITLSPVQPTSSHPGEPALGWPCFAEWVAECTLPVYALGGLDEADLSRAREQGAQGIAAISAWW
ncbi:Nudix family hydrolase [Marinobacterium sediminicola]|uniref:8-oxo-dGTP diphosphatase n=1 Tax=Marinobacterium sediminicola TaxID=518898 RepID=A0ABY1RWR5_9GAMM|nr:Nudix family hydrolase [Marinobacterium sediminicola]ULG70228.1 Nudix family hydrolase [Marinobacterium sediminicola]SMR70036.1 8-oxo-dGTP diphosphatase [Marinobacterium sediminicola]